MNEEELDILGMTEEEFLNEAHFLMEEDDFMRSFGKEWEELQAKLAQYPKSEPQVVEPLLEEEDEDIPF